MPAPKAYGKTAELISVVNQMRNNDGGGDSDHEAFFPFKRQYSSKTINNMMHNVVGLLQNNEDPNNEDQKLLQELGIRYQMIANPEVLQQYKEEVAARGANGGDTDADENPADGEADYEPMTNSQRDRNVVDQARIAEQHLNENNNRHVVKRNFDNDNVPIARSFLDVDRDSKDFNLKEVDWEQEDQKTWEALEKDEDLNPEDAWAKVKEKDEFEVSSQEANERALEEGIDKNNARFDQDDENLDIKEKLFKEQDVDTMWKKQADITHFISKKETGKDSIDKLNEDELPKKLTKWEEEPPQWVKKPDSHTNIDSKQLRFNEKREEKETNRNIKTTRKEKDWHLNSSIKKTDRDDRDKWDKKLSNYDDAKKVNQRDTVKDEKDNSWNKKREWNKKDNDRDRIEDHRNEKDEWDRKENERNKNQNARDKYDNDRNKNNRDQKDNDWNKKYDDRNDRDSERNQKHDWNKKDDRWNKKLDDRDKDDDWDKNRDWNKKPDNSDKRNSDYGKRPNFSDKKDSSRNKKQDDWENKDNERIKNRDDSNKKYNDDSYKQDRNKWDRDNENWPKKNSQRDKENDYDDKNNKPKSAEKKWGRDRSSERYRDEWDKRHKNNDWNKKDRNNDWDRPKNDDSNKKDDKNYRWNKKRKDDERDNRNKKPEHDELEKNRKEILYSDNEGQNNDRNNKNKKDSWDNRNKKPVKAYWDNKNIDDKFDNENKNQKKDKRDMEDRNKKPGNDESEKNTKSQGWDYWKEKMKNEGRGQKDDRNDDRKDNIKDDGADESPKRKPERSGWDRETSRDNMSLKKDNNERDDYKRRPQVSRDWSEERYPPKKSKNYGNYGRHGSRDGDSGYGTPIPHTGKSRIYDK